MATYGSPTVARRQLAAEVRGLRGDRRAAATAKALGWSMAKVSRYELGRGGYPPEEVAKLLDFYAVAEARHARLIALAEEANQRGWWEEYADSVSSEYLEYIGLEAGAESEVGWAITGIPGLLQTVDYARELNSFFKRAVTIPPAVLDRRVSLRMTRQLVLTERNPPLSLSVVIDESALLRPIGGPRIMAAQLRHLASVSELPNVHLQVLPLSEDSAPPPASFHVFSFGSEEGLTKLGDIVSIEGVTDNLLVEGEQDTYIYGLLSGGLAEVALSPSESRQLILQLAKRL